MAATFTKNRNALHICFQTIQRGCRTLAPHGEICLKFFVETSQVRTKSTESVNLLVNW